MTLASWYKRLSNRLQPLYGTREAFQIARWVMRFHFPEKHSLLIPNDTDEVPERVEVLLQAQLEQLLQGRPVQYVLQEAWFDDMRLHVTPDVLIPRPETEELVYWALDLWPHTGSALDVGTGSGCIALALKKHRPQQQVYALDASEAAIAVAQKNSQRLGCAIHCLVADVTNAATWASLPECSLIISNPPYIPQAEADQMSPTVTAHEPAMALFVPDNDPLIFYKLLAQQARYYLSPQGWLVTEIHERYASDIATLWYALDAQEVLIKKDLQGKDRMMAARWRKKE